MNRAESKPVCDLADRVLIVADQFFALLELDVQQVVLRRRVKMCLKQRLERRARDIELVTDLLDREWFCDPLIHIGEDLREKIVAVGTVVRDQRLMVDCLIKLHEEQKGLLQVAGHECPRIVRTLHTLNQQFPQDLLQLTRTVKCVVQDVESLSLIDLEYGCKIGCAFVDADFGRIGAEKDHVVGLEGISAGGKGDFHRSFINV